MMERLMEMETHVWGHGLVPQVASMSCPVNPPPHLVLSHPETKWEARKGKALCSGKDTTQG